MCIVPIVNATEPSRRGENMCIIPRCSEIGISERVNAVTVQTVKSIFGRRAYVFKKSVVSIAPNAAAAVQHMICTRMEKRSFSANGKRRKQEQKEYEQIYAH